MNVRKTLTFTLILILSINAYSKTESQPLLSTKNSTYSVTNKFIANKSKFAEKKGINLKNKNHLHDNGCHSVDVTKRAYSVASKQIKKVIDQANATLKNEQSPMTRSMASANAIAAMPANVTIPVVVHVVHNYGPEYIGEYQITDAIDQMNEDYAAYPYAGSVDGFGYLQADIGVQFKLATLDPQGNPTSGITYTVSNTTYDGTEGPLQSTINWPRDKYLNIWVVNSSDGTGSGSAYSNYPATVANGTGQEFWDGIVVSYWAIGRTGSAISTHHKIMSHEAGHWLNLKHVWGDVYDNGSANSCSTDDGVNDTPNTSGNSGCSSNWTCGTADNTENFMDYGTCTTMFSYGQSDRMRTALSSNVADRSNLWTTANLVATGLMTGNVAPVAMANGPYNASSGNSINFSSNGSNEPGGTLIGYHWSFGDGSTSSQANPIHTYAIDGTYSVTLTVTDDDGQTGSETTSASVFPAGTFISVESESNDSASQANGPIGPVSQVQGSISTSSDEDWFYFDLTAPDTVSIDVNILSNADLDFWVYHESDLNNHVAEAYTNNSLESVQFTASQAGRYYVYVDGWSTETSAYTLDIQATNIDGGGSSNPDGNVPDACASQAPQTSGSLQDGVAMCLGSNAPIWLSIAEVNSHNSVAISTGNGTGDIDIEYSNQGWPSGNNVEGSSANMDNNECIYITNQSQYWGYVKVTGNASGASIIVDFDSPACR